MTSRSRVLLLATTALVTLSARGAQAADNNCMSNPASCPTVPTLYQTCLANGTGPAPDYRSYGAYFLGDHPYATLSEPTKADVVTLMNNAARSYGFTPTTNLNWHAPGDALGGYYKWYPRPTDPGGSVYGFGLVLWNNKTGCAYFMSKNDTVVTSTSSRVTDKYASLNYERGPLGMPTSNPHPFATGAYNTSWQRFTNGYITYRQGDAAAFYVGGTSAAQKAVAARYGADFDLSAGLNRYPLSMDVACIGGVTSVGCTSLSTAGYYVRTNAGQRTILVRKTAITAYMVGGDLANRALAIKWHATYGASPWTGVLGFPKAEEATGVEGVGRAQAFEGGDILWTPASQAHVVLNGPVRDRWIALGREDGSLGYPVQDTPAGALPQVQAFMKGRITRTTSGTSSIADSNGFVPDVPGSFARIPSTSAPRSFLSDERDGPHDMDGVTYFQHIQGAQRIGRNRFVLSSANNGAMYFATLGSRASVSAHQPWGAGSLVPDASDHLYDVKVIHTDRPHLGGIQAVGDFIFTVSGGEFCLGGDPNPTCQDEDGAYLTLIDVNNPGVFVWDHLHVGKVFHAIGATKRLDGTYLLATLGSGDNDIFFSTHGADIRDTTAPVPLYHWAYGNETTFYPDGSSAYGNFYNYQSINLVTQGNGEIFLVGTEQHGVPAEDWAHLWRVDSCQSGIQPSCSCSYPDQNPNRVCMTFMGKREMYVTSPPFFGGYGDFDGGAGIYINPLGGPRDFFLYSTEKSEGDSFWGISEF